jgi:Lrp/AsnC family leucine-responsive transcriptional regulator
MTQIDAIDERILRELQANGRLTMKSLAESVGLSSPAMIERVRRLEERGVISGYRAIVVPEALGRPIAAFISASVDPDRVEGFVDALRDDPSIVECHRITGSSSHLLKVHVPDIAALELLADRLGRLGAGCDISMILSSPVSWREIASTDAVLQQQATAKRRRRSAKSGEAADHPAEGAAPRSPGRPRTRQQEG